MARASAIYAKRYQALAPREYLASLGFMEETGVPHFGTAEIDSEGAKSSFGSNLTVTWGDFFNVYHFDNDASPRAEGTWFTTDDQGNLVTDPKAICTVVEGGLFALPAFKLAVDFGACPGVADLMWSSTSDLHTTSPSKTHSGYCHIGTSIQVPKSTSDAHSQMAHLEPDERPVAGLEIRMLELSLGL